MYPPSTRSRPASVVEPQHAFDRIERDPARRDADRPGRADLGTPAEALKTSFLDVRRRSAGLFAAVQRQPRIKALPDRTVPAATRPRQRGSRPQRPALAPEADRPRSTALPGPSINRVTRRSRSPDTRREPSPKTRWSSPTRPASDGISRKSSVTTNSLDRSVSTRRDPRITGFEASGPVAHADRPGVRATPSKATSTRKSVEPRSDAKMWASQPAVPTGSAGRNQCTLNSESPRRLTPARNARAPAVLWISRPSIGTSPALMRMSARNHRWCIARPRRSSPPRPAGRATRSLRSSLCRPRSSDASSAVAGTGTDRRPDRLRGCR